jgi:hypothetical protein
MKILAMTPTEIPRLLAKYGIEDLRLNSHDEEKHIYTYGYGRADFSKMVKALGEPAVTSSGKVVVWTITSICKIGVSEGNKMIRVIDLNPGHADDVNTSHLSVKETTKELAFEYKKAQTTKKLRLPFMTKMWHFFNDTKFHGKLPLPTLMVSDNPPSKLSDHSMTHGLWYPTQRKLWVANHLFNSPEPFFNEILLHEMCHSAVTCIDHVNDSSEGGHGPHWQAWMKKVGLDPRRYDPTDESVYKTADENAANEEKDFLVYGPKTKLAEYRKIDKLPKPTSGQMKYVECYYLTKGRALPGVLRGKEFTWRTASGTLKSVRWKSTPDPSTFRVKD